MYINFLLEGLSELDVSLKDEERLIESVYRYASHMLYGFWDFNFCFFYDFFKNLPNEHKELAVLVFNKNIFVMEHTMVSFDELASAEKRLLLKKNV